MNVFPELTYNWNPSIEQSQYALEGGLTKRELFAAMAMQGLLHDPNNIPFGQNIGQGCALASVAFADALLAALHNPEAQP